ncbi:MAG TPA: molybdopterin-dependent oxidoreductase, partial [Planctomycetaceae bacterium]|nr:molybdopterin-dependent oxidoreductase [Planctomycetaceae bacterium]
KYIGSEKRLRQPLYRQVATLTPSTWNTVLPAVKSAIATQVKATPGKFAAIISPWATVEEAYLLAKLLKGMSPEVTLALGPVRTVGGDDHYPKTVTGAPPKNVKFTIRAEKCPNRQGVEGVLQHFQGSVIPFETVAAAVGAGKYDGLFVLNSDPEANFSAEFVQAAGKLKLLVVEDLLESSLSHAAHYVLAGAAWAEKEGTFVNHAGLAQGIFRGVRGPGEARPDGRILWELNDRKGLFRASTVRQEIAGEIKSFAALILGDLGEHGVMLKSPEPAAKELQPA